MKDSSTATYGHTINFSGPYKGPGRPKKEFVDDTFFRTTIIAHRVNYEKLKVVAMKLGRPFKDVLNDALLAAVETFEKKNGEITLRETHENPFKYDELGISDDEVEQIKKQTIEDLRREGLIKDENKKENKKKFDARNLYLIHNTIQNTLKIGISVNPNKRLRSLQTSTGDYLTLIFDIKGKAHLEKELHKEFADLRLASEWFKYDKRIIERFNGLRYGRVD